MTNLEQALQQIEVLRQQADDNQAILGEANYQELREAISASEASIRHQLAKHDVRLDWERRMLEEYNRLRGAA